MAAGMVIRELFMSLGLDVNEASFATGEIAAHGVEKALEKLWEKAKEMVAEFTELVVGTEEARHEMSEMAIRTGLSTDQLQRLKYAASFSGVSLGELGQSLNMLAKKGVHDVQGELLKLADQIHAMPADGRRAELAMSKFGRAGGKLVPILEKGREELLALFAEAPVASKESIEAADRFTASLIRIKAIWGAVTAAIVDPIVEALLPILTEVQDWLRANQAELKATRKRIGELIGGGIKLLWAGFKALGVVIDFVRANLKLLAIIVGGVLLAALIANAAAIWATVVGYVAAGAAAVIAGLAAAAAWIAAALPFIALAAAIIFVLLILEDLYQFLTGGDSVIGAFWNEFGDKIKEGLASAWEAVKQFFSDMVDAAGFTWMQVKLNLYNAFLDAIGKVRQLFTDLWSWVTDGISRLGTSLGHAIWGAASTILPFLPAPPGGGTQDSSAQLMGGGAQSPGASAQAGAGAGPQVSVNAPQITAPITINASAGMDEAALASQVRWHIEDTLKKHADEATEAVR